MTFWPTVCANWPFLNAGITITLTDLRKDDEGNTRQDVFHSDLGLSRVRALH